MYYTYLVKGWYYIVVGTRVPSVCDLSLINNIGAIVNYLPAFGAIDKKSELFDDDKFWEVSL